MTAPRVLFTASQRWSDVNVIRDALHASYLRVGRFTLVHGQDRSRCNTLADRIIICAKDRDERSPLAFADEFDIEMHAVNTDLGVNAEDARDAQMVRLGAVECLAFIGLCTASRCTELDIHPAHGPHRCAWRAEQRKIPVYHYWDPWLDEWRAIEAAKEKAVKEALKRSVARHHSLLLKAGR